MRHWNKSKNLFQSYDLLTIHICIYAYEIPSCCASSGREIFAYYSKLDDDALHMARQSCERILRIMGGESFDPMNARVKAKSDLQSS